jgi:prepilin signal peptidase PulO-like enzyme (type II secretory pathway)
MTKKNFGKYGAMVLAVLLAVPAVGKIVSMEAMVTQLSVNGVGDWITIIGLGLLASLVLFAIPKTKNIGTLLLSAYFGGTIVFHMALGEAFVVQAVLLVVVWTLAWMYDERIVLGHRSIEN